MSRPRSSHSPPPEEDEVEACRIARQFLDKYETSDLAELLAQSKLNWYLSTDDPRTSDRRQVEPPIGLINDMENFREESFYLLFPTDGIGNFEEAQQEKQQKNKGGSAAAAAAAAVAADGEREVNQRERILDLREVHLLIRELTIAIFACNQLPSLSLEANFDQSTQCLFPPAYINTKVGQLMIDVDYTMKSMWHGGHFQREKRVKFTERWRQSLNVNGAGVADSKKALSTEFLSAGFYDITKDPCYSTIYDFFPREISDSSRNVEDQTLFFNHIDDFTMLLHLFPTKIMQYKNLLLFHGDFQIYNTLKTTENFLDNQTYERISQRLQLQQRAIRQHLTNKDNVKRQVLLLKLISFLVPTLLALRRRMKIPYLDDLKKSSKEDTSTERELPPMFLSDDFKCPNFKVLRNKYFHLHGGVQFDMETITVSPPMPELAEHYQHIRDELAVQQAKVDQMVDMNNENAFRVSTVVINGERYYMVKVNLENYYNQTPQKPLWVAKLVDEIREREIKHLPIKDDKIHEIFKKLAGYEVAAKMKNLQPAVKYACQRGLAAPFLALCRKCNTARLTKYDDFGYAPLHYATINNRPTIITGLITQAVDVNLRQNNCYDSIAAVPRGQWTGPTPLHVTARCCALESLVCLLGHSALHLAIDSAGWAPVHHAAYFNSVPVLKLFLRKCDDQLELATKSDEAVTPLLLASMSGALDALVCLIEHGAKIDKTDGDGNNVIHLAVSHLHTNILQYFITHKHDKLETWSILIEILTNKGKGDGDGDGSDGDDSDDESDGSNEKEEKDDGNDGNDGDGMEKCECAVKCLEMLTVTDASYWKDIVDAEGVPALVETLKAESIVLQSHALSVLCNISEHDDVRRILTDIKAAAVLVSLLTGSTDEIRSRVAIILSDMACIEGNQADIAACGGMKPIVQMLDSDIEDVLINAVNCIRVLSWKNAENQNQFVANGCVEPLVEFLTIDSSALKGQAAAAIAALASNNRKVQDRFAAAGALKPLVDLVKVRRWFEMIRSAEALEALTHDNPEAQQAVLSLDGPKHLMRLVDVKAFSEEVERCNEQGACTLWALAGNRPLQQRDIAERLGVTRISDMLSAKSHKLRYVGCQAAIALTKENFTYQNQLMAAGSIRDLVRLLNQPVQDVTERVLHMVIKTLGFLCLGVAFQNNADCQAGIAQLNVIQSLAALSMKAPTAEIQTEAAHSLACIVLCNKENQSTLKQQSCFDIGLLVSMLLSPDMELRLNMAQAVTMFAFNNANQQYALHESGGISYECFQPLLDLGSDEVKAIVAFQMVVLARVILDVDQVSLTADGISTLVSLLSSRDTDIVVLSAKFLAGLSHSRVGLTDAMLAVDIDKPLVHLLTSTSKQEILNSVALALGYLTFNRTAARILLATCRNNPGMYEQLMKYLPADGKVSKDFVEDFQDELHIGLPSLSLEKYGGPPVQSSKSLRPQTSGAPLSKHSSTVKDTRRPATATAQSRPRLKSAPVTRKS